MYEYVSMEYLYTVQLKLLVNYCTIVIDLLYIYILSTM